MTISTGRHPDEECCAGCGAKIIHYEKVAPHAYRRAATDPQPQGRGSDRYVVCPHCGAENRLFPCGEDEGGDCRDHVEGLRPKVGAQAQAACT